MDSNITINIVKPGSPTPAPVVPNTGLFTSSIGGPEITTISISTVLILTMVAIIITALLYRKQKKSGKVTKLVHIIGSTKAVITNKKRITAGLTALALLASVGTFAALLSSANKSNTSAAEGEDAMVPVVSDDELTIELGDEPVFACLPVEVTVEEATEAGYTLTAFTDSIDLVSTTDESKTIPMITVDEGELAALADNTYGLALTKPASQDEEIFTVLSTDADTPTILAEKEEATEADDKTTIYYGFYITPDTPYGTYTGSDINYTVEENGPDTATVVFDGNGLYFNGDEGQTENIANYAVEITDETEKYSHTPNITDEGVQEGDVAYNTFVNNVVTIPGAASVKVSLTYGGGYAYSYQMGYLSFWQGAHPDYRANINYETGIQKCGESTVTDGKYYTEGEAESVECTISGDSVTFDFWTQGGGPGGQSWYGYYAVVTGYDADGNIIYLPENNLVSGDYLIPSSGGYSRFIGWDKSSEATTPAYATKEDIEKGLGLTPGETTTLYAIWQPDFTITYNGNGADSTTDMDNVVQYTTDLESDSKSVDLLASNFKKEGYGFAGWSTDQNAWEHLTDNDETNNPTIYGPNQMITVDPSASTKLNLYAVWVPAETTASGDPVELQSWQGCSNLTATTYDAETGTLNVSKNTITALTDSRDGNIYTVARLADGNCWMTENLRLDNEPELSSTNTHNPSLPLTNNYEGQITSNKLSEPSNKWCNNWSTTEEQIACYDHSNLNTNNIVNAGSPLFSQDFTNSSHSSHFDGNITSYSNYYNWYSATAGNGKQETGSGVTVAGDICPAGWILPIGGQTDAKGSFSHLDVAMGGTGDYQASTEASNRWRSFPNNFVYSGSWYGSSANTRGYYGYYWSSTAGSTGSAYNLSFYSGYVYPGTSGNNKSYGYSVRCVAPAE